MANETQVQIRHSFDRITLLKIGRGALIAGTGGAALYLFGILGGMDLGSVWTPIIAMIVPTLVNIVKEWLRGV